MLCVSGVIELVLPTAASAAVHFLPGVPVQTVGWLYPALAQDVLPMLFPLLNLLGFN